MVIKNLLINKIKKDANPPKPISIEDYNRMDKAKKKRLLLHSLFTIKILVTV